MTFSQKAKTISLIQRLQMLKLRMYSQLNFLLKRTMSNREGDVVFDFLNNAGVITLNRPKVLNSLNTSMVTTLVQLFREMESSKHLVIIKGAGDAAFCAGGDLKTAFQNVDKKKFLRIKYNMIYLIAKYKIPYIAFLNGVAFGSGLGISVPGRYRVMTEKSIIAMPETRIGLFPDVGASYFLPRLNDNLGIYLGLTGNALRGKDTVTAGIGTHFVSSAKLGELEKLLSTCTSDLEIQNLLNKFNEPPGEFSLISNIDHIKYCFDGSTVEEIIERLETVQNDWSIKTLNKLRQLCPGSLKIALRFLHRGAHLELSECLKMEFHGVNHALANHDFPEGIRALLIDKDNKPQWKPKTLAEVDDDYVESYLTIHQQGEDLNFFDF